MSVTKFKCKDCGNTTCTSVPKNNYVLKIKVQTIPENGKDCVCCNCKHDTIAESMGMTREEYSKDLINSLDKK